MMALRFGRPGRRQPRLFRRAAAALGLSALTALAGCSSTATDSSLPACPPVFVLKDADTVTRFGGGGHDLVDVVNSGEITGYDVSCEYNLDKKTKAGKAAITLGLHMTATRGPADRTRQADYQYFVAVTDPDRNVLNKRVFDFAAVFTGNLTTTTIADDPVSMTIPIPAGKTGQDFAIFIGFQLTPDEVAYNRRNGAARAP
jgi:hypothetical protein